MQLVFYTVVTEAGGRGGGVQDFSSLHLKNLKLIVLFIDLHREKSIGFPYYFIHT